MLFTLLLVIRVRAVVRDAPEAQMERRAALVIAFV